MDNLPQIPVFFWNLKPKSFIFNVDLSEFITCFYNRLFPGGCYVEGVWQKSRLSTNSRFISDTIYYILTIVKIKDE